MFAALRRHARDLPATARAQRWEPPKPCGLYSPGSSPDVEASSISTRRAAAGFRTGTAFDTWDEQVSPIPAPTQRSLTTLEWIDHHENLVVCEPSGADKSRLLEALGHAAIGTAATCSG